MDNLNIKMNIKTEKIEASTRKLNTNFQIQEDRSYQPLVKERELFYVLNKLWGMTTFDKLREKTEADEFYEYFEDFGKEYSVIDGEPKRYHTGLNEFVINLENANKSITLANGTKS